MRDTYFNKEKVFNGNTKILKCNIKNISLEYLIKIVKNTTYRIIIIILLTIYNNTVKDFEWFYKSEGNKKNLTFKGFGTDVEERVYNNRV